MPTIPVPLFCSPQDIYEQIGIDAAQLRLDDMNQASGQTVQATADAASGATSITISTLQYPLLKGTILQFTNAAMSDPIQATLSAVASVGATSLTVTALDSAITSGATATDNGVNVWLGGMMVKACRYAAAKIQDYCVTRYDATQLVQSYTVNQWAVTIAAKWLATRLYRAAPEQIQSAFLETIEELKEVKAGLYNIALAAPRTSEWPFMSNVTIDHRYTDRVVRVEPQLSEPTPTQYAQSIDWTSYYSIEW